jgi:peroxiredoxin
VADSESSATSRVGGALPDFELPDHEGKSWRLSDQLARGPVVVVFYRGDW